MKARVDIAQIAHAFEAARDAAMTDHDMQNGDMRFRAAKALDDVRRAVDDLICMADWLRLSTDIVIEFDGPPIPEDEERI